MATDIRKAAAGLIASAALVVSLMNSEWFVGTAAIPVPEDRPTYGYGETIRPDGKPVQIGDKIDKPTARARLEYRVENDYAAGIRKCAGDVPMHQYEFDALGDMAYNMGVPTVCKASIVRLFREGKYREGCDTIFTFDKLNGKHCRDPLNLKTVPGCRGIMNRRQKQFDMCIGKGY